MLALITLLTWCGDLIALATAIGMLKDILIDRTSTTAMTASLTNIWRHRRAVPWQHTVESLRPFLRFAVRIAVLVMIVASAGVCLVFPTQSLWPAMLLRTALALHMATHVPCPWLRWITVGDIRAKLNDPPGVERRDYR